MAAPFVGPIRCYTTVHMCWASRRAASRTWVEALGIAPLSKSEVSRIRATLDAEVDAFRQRPLLGELYRYLWLGATCVKVRDAGRVVPLACLVAIGVAGSGERRVLGLDLAASSDGGNAWTAFVRDLLERGLSGVRLVISVAHRGIHEVVRSQLLGAGGNAAGCMRRATPSTCCPPDLRTWWRPRSTPSSRSPTIIRV